MYTFCERTAKAGIKNVCIHKGLFPAFAEEAQPHLAAHASVGDVGKAAKDSPQLNFVIYHSGYPISAVRRPMAWTNGNGAG